VHPGSYFRLMAEYNRWMNRNLYAVCAQLPDARRKADLGAFFKSVHGTFNHILWADRAWLRRFTDRQFPVTPIGQELFEDFETLRAERAALDDIIVDWAAGLEDDWLGRTLEFKSMIDGKTRRGPNWVFVAQMFNHQTHHRGQITTLIKQLGVDPGVTDIPWLPGAVELC
jgi:uncharacterized damage-inducible protein DinB